LIPLIGRQEVHVKTRAIYHQKVIFWNIWRIKIKFATG